MTRTLMALFALFSVAATAQDKLILYTRAKNCDLRGKLAEVYAVTATHLKAKKDAERFLMYELSGIVLENANEADAETYVVDLNVLNRPLDIQYSITITRNSEEIWYCGGMMITKDTNFTANIDVLTQLSLQHVCESTGDDTLDIEIPLDLRNSIISALQ